MVSNCDLGGMYSYSPASQSFARLVLISFAQRLMTIQHEISGFRIFHTVRDEEAGKPDSLTSRITQFFPQGFLFRRKLSWNDDINHSKKITTSS
ncbi:MAG: hypothetical protein K9M81_00145 [Chthoniobacterales bacterium]|nr:hypothetical protein [Chthoniobacterales bacterium]